MITFYKETNFKETPIGKMPKDWEFTRASDVAEYINGYAFGPKDWKSKGLPIIRIQNLNDPKAEFNYFDGDIDEKYKVKNGDLLFSWSASLGVYIWKGGDAVLNQHIFKVIPKPFVDKLFLYYALFVAISQLKRKIHGSTMKHFRRRELSATFIPRPPLPEQKAIAYVLSTVDKAIQKTNEIIEKTKRLKKGLMQELLTKGIGHKEFKDTEIGRIPKEWKVVRLEEIAEKSSNSFVDGPFGSDLKKEEFVNHGIPVIQLHNISEGLFIDDDLKYITEEKFRKLIRHETRPYDVIIAKIGDVEVEGKNPIARACVIPSKFRKYMIVADCVRLRPNRTVVNPYFLQFMINSRIVRIQAIAAAKGTTRKRINLSEIRKLSIPLPPLLEQEKIAEILSVIDEKLKIERKEKERLERIKQALMELLLTGKVRVKVNEGA